MNLIFYFKVPRGFMRFVKIARLALIFQLLGTAHGEIIQFEGGSSTILTTGNLLDEVDHIGITTHVVEIEGLLITARSGAANQKINVTNTSLGINADGADDTDAFENGEQIILSFNKAIRINQLDFNLFDADESFTLVVDGFDPVVIAFNDLSNKTSDLYDSDFWIPANTDMALFTTGTSVIGLDAMDVTVDAIPEPAVLGLVGLSGVGLLMVRRIFMI